MRGFFASFTLCLGVTACSGEAPPAAAPEEPPTPGLSPIAALGKRLFRDESLSASGRLSCQTCHEPGFAHAAPTGDLMSEGGPGMDLTGIRN